MIVHFPIQPKWNRQQQQILSMEPNAIIQGCAGSGKTLLACHIAMQRAEQNSVAILVFTKSLRTFIKNYINSFGINNIEILYEYEWAKRKYPDYDVIIVDEFQDFSANDISNIIQHSTLGVYLFGDVQQQLYSKNFQKEKTVNFEELIKLTGFETILLSDSFRISEANKEFIDSFYKKKLFNTGSDITSPKPQIVHLTNSDEEISWIKEFLLSNNEYQNIGILLKRNKGFRGAYYHKRKLRKEYVYGIVELHDYLLKFGIESFYKYESLDNLNFSNEKNINIMTYHSSKGLQFDCIILPFCNYINENNGVSNLPYVGLTRASKKIIITYSGLISDEYSVPVLKSVFEGEMLRKSSMDGPTFEQEAYNQMKIGNMAGLENIKLRVDEFDISDCEIYRI